jgi:integration host factor subunit alpha
MTTTPHRTAKIGAQPVSSTHISRPSQERPSPRKPSHVAVVKAEDLSCNDGRERAALTLTRELLQSAVYSCCEQVSRTAARKIIDAVLDEIRAELAAGEDVHLRGFGTFSVREKRPRMGRNPKTGVEAEICARRVVTFKASPTMVARINSNITSRAHELSAITEPDTN